jgi:hypothetical protein
MTTETTARAAGAALLLYIAAGISEMSMSSTLNGGDGTLGRLANIAQHAVTMRWFIVLLFVELVCAIVLAVTFHALTRHVDPELAMLGLAFRFAEGLIGLFPIIRNVGLLSLATSASPANEVTAAVLFRAAGWNFALGSTLFAIASTIFAALFIRGRLIPSWLAWTGLAGSVVMIAIAPLEGFRLIPNAAAWVAWAPLFVFEVTLAVWLVVKLVPTSHPRAA